MIVHFRPAEPRNAGVFSPIGIARTVMAPFLRSVLSVDRQTLLPAQGENWRTWMGHEVLRTERILFSGRVQGVWFRKTTCRLVADLAVTGYVRNLADRRVEIVISGPESAIDTLIVRLTDHFRDGITNVERTVQNRMEEFSGFEIR